MSKYYPIVLIPAEYNISEEIEIPVSPILGKSFFGLLSLKSDKQNYQKELKEHDKLKSKHQYQTMLKGSDEFLKFSTQKEFINQPKSVPNLEAYRDFDNIKKGMTEDFFLKELKSTFGNRIYTGLVIEEFFKSIAYVPDFVFIDQSKNIYIDIEIDEPYYMGKDSKPIHYLGSDNNRDEYFLDNGWIVLRFTEEQIVKYPNRCQKEIAKIIFQLTDDYSYLYIFSNIRDLESVKQWNKIEAEEMIKNNYRKTYLHFLNSGELYKGDSVNVANSGIIKRKVSWVQEFEPTGKLKRKELKQLVEYDINNSIVLEINYSWKNFVDNKVIMKYNDYGKLIEKVKLVNRNRLTENNFVVQYVESYFYDAKNRLIEERVKKEYSNEIYKFVYSDIGSLIEKWKWNDNDNSIDTKEFRTYENGNLTEIKNYEHDMLRYITTYKYDQNGNLIKLLKVDGKNIMHAKDENEYNVEGDLVKSESFDLRYSRSILTREYFSKGKPSEQMIYFSGNLESGSLTKYVYDEFGQLIEENFYDIKRTIKYTRKFENDLEVEETSWDGNGNVTSKIIIEYENWN